MTPCPIYKEGESCRKTDGCTYPDCPEGDKTMVREYIFSFLHKGERYALQFKDTQAKAWSFIRGAMTVAKLLGADAFQIEYGRKPTEYIPNSEDEGDRRMRAIMQNGNNGEHYNKN